MSVKQESQTKEATNGASECAPETLLTQQSPIEIISSDAFYAPKLNAALSFNYDGEICVKPSGDHGHANLVVEGGSASISFLGLEAPLKAIHIHNCGEHRVDGKLYPLEIHLIHQIPAPPAPADGDPYCEIIKEEPNGKQIVEIFHSQKVVVGLFCEESDPNCKTPKSFVPVLQKVLGSKEIEPCEMKFKLSDLIPDDKDKKFYHYQGSLTSGNFEEYISWLVMKEPVTVDGANLKELRKSAEQDPREAKPLNRRFVLRNFEYSQTRD